MQFLQNILPVKNDFGTFVPRFARNENNLIKDCYESYKNLLKLEKKFMSRQFYFRQWLLFLQKCGVNIKTELR